MCACTDPELYTLISNSRTCAISMKGVCSQTAKADSENWSWRVQFSLLGYGHAALCPKKLVVLNLGNTVLSWQVRFIRQGGFTSFVRLCEYCVSLKPSHVAHIRLPPATWELNIRLESLKSG